jgi:Tfp pilus assembly protein PilZ
LDHQNSERRSAVRANIAVTETRVGDEREYFFGYAMNVSKSGAFIHTLRPRKAGEEFDIQFTVPRTGIFVKCRAKVVWIREFAQGETQAPGMGVNFIGIDPEVAERLDKWAREYAATHPATETKSRNW